MTCKMGASIVCNEGLRAIFSILGPSRMELPVDVVCQLCSGVCLHAVIALCCNLGILNQKGLYQPGPGFSNFLCFFIAGEWKRVLVVR